MTFRALQRRRLVKENLFAGDLPHGLVTKVTLHVGVTALERELRPLIVIKCRRHPSHYVVAVCARRFSRLCHELPAVGVRVAFLAALRCSFELCLLRAG